MAWCSDHDCPDSICAEYHGPNARQVVGTQRGGKTAQGAVDMAKARLVYDIIQVSKSITEELGGFLEIKFQHGCSYANSPEATMRIVIQKHLRKLLGVVL